ncbi:Hypothetical predicted protein [Paramuricea clavata]|uniref:Uncharacterized protein n=1 Tax=Paramuricea clavata TaxID=317549 RepID=A0A6S7K4P3_PARCT|nr:Hypothetical predicted protein [Paramuricea clavata]
MASPQQQQDLKLFFEYQDIVESDPNRLYYVQKFTDFQFFRLNNPKYLSFDKAYIKWLQLPNYRTMASNTSIIGQQPTFFNDPLPPAYTTTTAANLYNNYYHNDLLNIINPLNPNTLLPNNDEVEYLMNETTEVLESSSDNQTPPTSPTISTPPPAPPPLPPRRTPLKNDIQQTSALVSIGKNIKNLKENLKNRKRKAQNKSGRPNKHVHLTRIANDQADEEKITSQDLILYALDGTEKKHKMILTTNDENIETYNVKHYQCYLQLAEEREQALERIKTDKDKLEKLCYLEKFTLEALKNRKNRKLEKALL